MKTRTVLLAVAFCVCAVATSFAADPNLGTWKLNESKSKIPAGIQKNTSVVYTAAGDSYKCVVEGVDASGKPAHNEWTGKFDGKDYAVIGDPANDSRAIQKVNDRHYKLSSKKNGKTTVSGTIELSADGKTRTVTTSSTDASGKKVTVSFVYDKQ